MLPWISVFSLNLKKKKGLRLSKNLSIKFSPLGDKLFTTCIFENKSINLPHLLTLTVILSNQKKAEDTCDWLCRKNDKLHFDSISVNNEVRQIRNQEILGLSYLKFQLETVTSMLHILKDQSELLGALRGY